MQEIDLVARARNHDADALDVLLRQYKPLVLSRANAYFLIGGDLEDLIQEGMIGLYKAIQNFDASKNIAFAALASMCVDRQIQDAIKAASREKHKILNTSVALDNTFDGENAGLHNVISTYDLTNPEIYVLSREASHAIMKLVSRVLSPFEYDVLMHYVQNLSQQQIAEATGKSKKSIDNALQRIKKKVRAALQAKADPENSSEKA